MMPVIVTLPRRDINKFERAARQLTGGQAFLEEAGEAIQTVLRSSPYWPRKSGFSGDNFGYVLDDTTSRGRALTSATRPVLIRVINLADYAPIVEERTGAAARTLAEGAEQVAKAADEYVDGGAWLRSTSS